MTDILEEILNDEKDAKRLQIFRKIFPVIIVLTLIIAIGMACYAWFASNRTKHNQETGDLFLEVILGDYKDGKLMVNLLEEIKINNEDKLSELASIKLASRHIQNNNIADALVLLEDIVNNKQYSEVTKSYARILYITLILDLESLNTGQEQHLTDYLKYFNHEEQVFYSTATLLKSLFYIKDKQLSLARNYALEVLKLPRASGVIKEQAKAVITMIEHLEK